MNPKKFQEIYRAHQNYWDDRRAEMRNLRNAYANRYWHKGPNEAQIAIEVPRAYEYVEGFLASLFARNPAVIVKSDIRGRGTPGKVQSLANEFLKSTRTQLEDACRLAIIYPNSFIKLSILQNDDPFARIETSCIAPWDCIVDLDAAEWNGQSYCAHRYYLTHEHAKKKYGNKKFAIKPLKRYLDTNDTDKVQSIYRSFDDNKEPQDGLNNYVEIVEVYDIDNNKFYIWSPDYQEGKKWVEDGIDIEVGDEDNVKIEKFNEIPFSDMSNNPVVPIIPMYFSRMPDLPLRGYSALRRVYDQIVETNTIRTYQAAMIRRAARQWVVEKGVFDDISLSKISQGHDGEFIEVQLSQGQTLQGSIMAMPHTPVPHELEQYFNQVQTDLQRGTVMAPFTRGEATKATATENLLLAAYTSSEVGRLARERDSVIESMADVYIAMQRIFLGDDSDIILLDGRPEAISLSDLDGNFGYFAQDSGSTPVSEAVKKQEFLMTVPILQQLGVNPQAILQEIVRLFDLPEGLLPGALPNAEPEQPQPSPSGMQSPQIDAKMQAATAQPQPAQVSNILGIR